MGVSKRYFRPTEVEHLLGDSRKAKTVLGWEAKTPFNKLVEEEMVENDLEMIEKEGEGALPISRCDDSGKLIGRFISKESLRKEKLGFFQMMLNKYN